LEDTLSIAGGNWYLKLRANGTLPLPATIDSKSDHRWRPGILLTTDDFVFANDDFRSAAPCSFNPGSRIMPLIKLAKPTRLRPLRAAAVPVQKTDVRLGQIIRVLTDHAMVAVSGTKTGDEIGPSRSEVWRLIQQLRTLGVAIDGHPATGYQLRAVPDLLLAD